MARSRKYQRIGGGVSKAEKAEIMAIAKKLDEKEVDKPREKKAVTYQKCLEYLSNPDELAIDVNKMMKRLGYKSGVWRLSGETMREIYGKALANRRMAYAKRLMKVDHALFKFAEETGHPAAAKLVYQRFEDWVEPAKAVGRGNGGIEDWVDRWDNEEREQTVRERSVGPDGTAMEREVVTVTRRGKGVQEENISVD